MRKFYRALIAFFLFLQIQVPAQVALSSSPYVQDFNSLSNGADNTPVSTPAPPNGWSFLETGTGANTSYRPHTGSGNSGDTYSFGATTNTERAFGQLRSGSVISTIGASFQNNTGSTLNSITISYVGEQWRLGALSRTTNEKMDFQFSLDATSLSSPNWTDVNELDFTPPITAGTVGALDGNAASNRVTVTFTIVNLNIAHGSTFWIRWNDVDATSSDDGLAIDDFQLTFASGDATPPIFTINYPKTSNLSDSGFGLITNLNEPGKTFFVVLPNNATAPTSTQVKNGKDATGVTLAAGFFGMIDVANATTDYNAVVTGLVSATEYDVYLVAEDVVHNLQASPIKLDVLTNTAGDVTPPMFNFVYPEVDSTATTLTVRTKLNEAGKTYFVVLPFDAVAPSSAQVKSGQNGSGVAVASNLAGTINVTSASTEFTALVSGLTPSTWYDVYMVAEDNVPNLQPSPTSIRISTADQFLEDFNMCDGTASFTQFSASGAQVWGCTDFGRNSTKGIRMNGFSGSAQFNQDWLISPVTNLSANASLSFYSQFSFAGPVLQLKISTNYSGSGDPSLATWTDLNGNFPTVAVPSTSTSLSDWALSNVDLSAYAWRNVYVAFVYNSTTTAAARWSLDDISISNAAASYIQASPSSLLFTGGGTVKNYSLRGFNLSKSFNSSKNVAITASSNFTLSKDNNSFSSSISFTATEMFSVRTVYVKFEAPTGTTATFTGLITHEYTGVPPKTITVKGTDKSQTFDITTFNLEFFGTDVKDTGGSEFGPIDDALQINNVTTVLQNIGADIFAVQEVADDAAFNQLVSNISGFSGMLANRWSYSFDPPDANFPPQKIGFIYNSSTVQLVSSRVMFTQLYDAVRAGNTGLLPGYPTTASSFWSSGRLPFMATFDVTVAGATKRVRVVNIHAKSGSATGDYNRRKYDVKVLHDSLIANYANDNIILLGDYNDDVDVSIGAPTNPESTYKVFVDNTTNFNSLTLAISQTGAFSFPSSSSFLDHLTTSNELTNSYISNSIIVEDPRTYITNYVNTTSDHLPVSARFVITKEDQTITFPLIADKNVGDAPFTFTLPTATSGLAVTVTPNSKITISGNQITLVSAGKASIVASQPGNGNYNAAISITREFCIKPAKPSVTVSFASGTATLTSNAANGNQWYLNGAVITGATNASYTATNAGTYKAQVTIDNCLSDFSNDVPVVITGDLTKGNASISLYPNPTAGSLFISGLEPETNECSIVDLLGRPIMMNLEKSGDQHRLTTESLADGVYMLRVKQSNSVLQLRFVKKN
jgi:endonuclease/exonuclease/phosphatase family metal-dependent hydrolase